MYSHYNHPIFGQCIATVGCCKRAGIYMDFIKNTQSNDTIPLDVVVDNQMFIDDICKKLEENGDKFTPEFKIQRCIYCKQETNMQHVDIPLKLCPKCTKFRNETNAIYHHFNR